MDWNTTGALSASLPEVNQWTSESKKCAATIEAPARVRISLEASPKYKGVLDWLAAHP